MCSVTALSGGALFTSSDGERRGDVLVRVPEACSASESVFGCSAFLPRPPPQSPDLRARGRASDGMLATTVMRMVMTVTMTTDETSHGKRSIACARGS